MANPHGEPGAGDMARTLFGAALHGHSPSIRMIDGELAFPDEIPADDWHELRVMLPGGMVTLVRGGDTIRCVIWGNADEAMKRSWNSMAHAVATVTDGTIVTDAGMFSPSQFAEHHAL